MFVENPIGLSPPQPCPSSLIPSWAAFRNRKNFVTKVWRMPSTKRRWAAQSYDYGEVVALKLVVHRSSYSQFFTSYVLRWSGCGRTSTNLCFPTDHGTFRLLSNGPDLRLSWSWRKRLTFEDHLRFPAEGFADSVYIYSPFTLPFLMGA